MIFLLKLSEILNAGIPDESNIKLIVYPVAIEKGYPVQIEKNGKGLEYFYITVEAANRLVTNVYGED